MSYFELLNLAELYLRMPYFWDGIIFLMIFLGLTTHVFTKQSHFGRSKQSKLMAIGVGLALTVSLLVFEWQTGFYIGNTQFALFPAIIITLLFTYLLTTMLKDFLEWPTYCAAAFSFLFAYPAVQGMFAYPFNSAFRAYTLLEPFVMIMYIFSVGSLISCIVKLFSGPKASDTPDSVPRKTLSEHGKSLLGRGPGTDPNVKKPATNSSPNSTSLPSLQKAVQDFEDKVGKMISHVKLFTLYGDRALDMNNVIHKGGASPSALTHHISDFTKEGKKIGQIYNEAEVLLNSLNSSSDLGSLPEVMIKKLTQAYAKYFQISLAYDQYFMQWQDFFNKDVTHEGKP